MPNSRPETIAGTALLPAVFVLLWSTGFIGAKLGLPYAEPFTFLGIRFAVVASVMLAMAVMLRAPWPSSPKLAVHICVVGLLLHGIYLGGVFAAIHQGIGAGVAALIVGTQPLLTATLVGPLLGERVTLRQWSGFLSGFGGVALVVTGQLSFRHGDLGGFVLAVGALLGITAGTLYQKRFCTGMDLRTGSVIQFVAAGILMLVLAVTFETREVQWTGQFLFALGWLSLVLSVGAVSVLYVLIRRGAAARVASLFYLVPPVTAVVAYFVFGETLSVQALAGIVLATVGVALVNR